MTIQVLPTRTDIGRYNFELELDGQTYTFDFEWNDRDQGWYMTITDINENVLLAGRRIVLNWPLISRYRDAGLPAGTLEAIDTGSNDVEPGFADLGDRVKLLYTPLADL